MKRVAIVGGAGRMGQAMAEGLGATGRYEVVALVDPHEPTALFGARHETSISQLVAGDVDAVVDFSNPKSVVASATWCAEHAVPLVIGTTGLNASERAALETAAVSTHIVMASNFALGAVLTERFAALAAPYFERVEIIESHHDRKVDAPSGTSISTARAINDARTRAGRGPMKDPTERHTIEGARGADAGNGVRIHAVRLPGLVAREEVLFGGPGEGLTIRHDSYDRQSFVQGVALALEHVDETPGLTIGIASFIG